MRTAVALLVTFLGPAVMLRAAETVTIGGAVVPVPDGWKQTDKDDTVILTPPGLPAEMTCTLTFLGGEPFDGSLKDQFAAEWKAMEKFGRLTDFGDAGLSGTGTELEMAGQSGRIDNEGKRSAYVWLLLMRANRRIDRVLLVADDPDTFEKQRAAAVEIVHGINFVAPRPLGPLQGACFAVVQVKTSLRPECWVFLPDGVVYHGFPIGGLANVDFDALRKADPHAFGEYRKDGDDVLVTLERERVQLDDHNGEKVTTRFVPSNGAWTATVMRPFQDRRSGRYGNTIAAWTESVEVPIRLRQADPCDGLKLAATYRLDVTQRPVNADQTPPSIKFTADGQFTEDGLIRAVDPRTPKAGGGVEPSAMPRAGGRGTYSIAKNTLSVTYQDGKKLSLTFFVPRDDRARTTPLAIYLHQSQVLLVP